MTCLPGKARCTSSCHLWRYPGDPPPQRRILPALLHPASSNQSSLPRTALSVHTVCHHKQLKTHQITPSDSILPSEGVKLDQRLHQDSNQTTRFPEVSKLHHSETAKEKKKIYGSHSRLFKRIMLQYYGIKQHFMLHYVALYFGLWFLPTSCCQMFFSRKMQESCASLY